MGAGTHHLHMGNGFTCSSAFFRPARFATLAPSLSDSSLHLLCNLAYIPIPRPLPFFFLHPLSCHGGLRCPFPSFTLCMRVFCYASHLHPLTFSPLLSLSPSVLLVSFWVFILLHHTYQCVGDHSSCHVTPASYHSHVEYSTVHEGSSAMHPIFILLHFLHFSLSPSFLVVSFWFFFLLHRTHLWFRMVLHAISLLLPIMPHCIQPSSTLHPSIPSLSHIVFATLVIFADSLHIL